MAEEGIWHGDGIEFFLSYKHNGKLLRTIILALLKLIEGQTRKMLNNSYFYGADDVCDYESLYYESDYRFTALMNSSSVLTWEKQ